MNIIKNCNRLPLDNINKDFLDAFSENNKII